MFTNKTKKEKKRIIMNVNICVWCHLVVKNKDRGPGEWNGCLCPVHNQCVVLLFNNGSRSTFRSTDFAVNLCSRTFIEACGHLCVREVPTV